MLRIHEVTSATDAKRYYAASDYYQQGQEVVGQWGGRLAAKLGLSGPVDKAGFDALCDNRNPADGSSLTLRTNAERRVGYDMVFSSPKSFSVIEALAPEAERLRLLKAFDDAVCETMEMVVEPDMRCRVRVGGADSDRTTGNLIWAGFDHSTSRPVDGEVPDMHRHKHVLCFNATFDAAEGRIKAGQFGDIKRDGEFYTAAFYSRLAGKLEELGYAIDRRGDKKWEVAGVPQAVTDIFSKRTDEVEAEAERKGVTDATRKAGLGAKTRGRKQKELTPDELRRAWDAQLSDGDRDALAVVYGKGVAKGRGVTPAEAVAFAIAHCSEKLSVFPERELQRVALLHGLGSVTLDDVKAESPRQGVIVREFDGRMMATTKGLQSEEDYLIGRAAAGRGAVQPIGVAEGLERGRLNDGQWQAVCGLLNSSSRVNLIEGPAGAGKSSLLASYDVGMKLAGQSVTYLATTAAAVKVLQKDGFEANTLARFLLDEKLQKSAAGGRVVIDETSMLGHKDAVRLFELGDKLDLKFIFCGDQMQHGSVLRGSLMHVLKAYGGIKPFRLREIMRQDTPEYRAVAGLLSEGKTVEGFDALDQRLGWVRELPDAERYQKIAAEYLQALADKKSVLVVSPTHAEAVKITDAIRGQLKAAGKLGQEREFIRLVAVDATEAERGQASTYRPGDVIQFHQNAKGGFTRGQRVTVSDPASLPLNEAGKFSLYRPENISLAVGDTIRFTATVKTIDGEHKLTNGAAYSVAGFDRKGIRLDNGWIVPADAGHFRHGLVETSFGSQGRTVQRAIIAVSSQSLPATNQEQIYVSSTRAKEKLTLYTDDKAAVRAAVKRSSSKLAASDLRTEARSGQAEASERLHQQRARRKRFAFYQRLRSAWLAASRPFVPQAARLTFAGRETARREERDYGHGR